MEFDHKIVSVILASAVALAASLISLWQSSRTQKAEREAKVTLQDLQITFNARIKAFEEATKITEPKIQLLSKIWADIQSLKTCLDEIINAESNDDINSLKKNAMDSARRIIDDYKNSSIVEGEVRLTLHDLKNRCYCVRSLLFRVEENVKYTDSDTIQRQKFVHDRINKVRNDLTQYQNYISNVMHAARDVAFEELISQLTKRSTNTARDTNQ